MQESADRSRTKAQKRVSPPLRGCWNRGEATQPEEL